MKQLAPETKLLLSYKTAVVAMLSGLALSPRLWISERLFPTAPLIRLLPAQLDRYLFLALVIALLVALLARNLKQVTCVLLLFIAVLLLQDQNRIQPWVYLYALVFVPFALTKKEDYPSLLGYLQLLLVAVYFWSGLQKLNSSFINSIFASILSDLFGLTGPLAERLLPFGYSLGALEVLAAVLLLFQKTKHIGIGVIILSHLFIMLYISPLGIDQNTVIYPWNIAMIILVFLCFYKTPDIYTSIKKLTTKPILIAIAALACLLPLLNFFNYWDNYLSFSLYSGKEDQYFIAIDNRSVSKIDPQLYQYFTPANGAEGGRIIHVNVWSMNELNSPVYPETRVFRQIAKTFCSLGIDDDQLYFLSVDPDQNYRRFTCKDLE